MSTTCSSDFRKIFKFFRGFAFIVGADVFNPNYKLNPITWFVIICTNVFFVLSGYTIYVALYIEKNWISMLKALCMVGSAVQGITKLYAVISMKQIFRQIHKSINEVYLVYEQKHIGYQRTLHKTNTTTIKTFKLSIVLYLTGALGTISVPIFYNILFGEKIFVMQFLIPGVDPLSDEGYYILNICHATCILTGAIGNFAWDILFFICILQVPLYKNILKLKFEDINKMAIETNDDSSKTMPLLIDVIKWHQKYTDFSKTLGEANYLVLFVQTFTTSMNIGMTVFITFLGAWPAGYAYLIYSFGILYVYCGMGTVTEYANDSVCDQVYNTCLWYRLSVSEQKMLRIMLMKAQNPTTLTVGDVMPLSVTTGLSLTKTIYSFLMMMLNFAEE